MVLRACGGFASWKPDEVEAPVLQRNVGSAARISPTSASNCHSEWLRRTTTGQARGPGQKGGARGGVEPGHWNDNRTVGLVFGAVEVVKLLLDMGADPMKKMDDRPTPLFHAVVLGHKDIAELLCGHLEEPNPRMMSPRMKITLLHLACFEGALGIYRRLPGCSSIFEKEMGVLAARK